MHPYDAFIHKVARPARYMGGEYNQVVKPDDAVACRFCLCFPDVYDIGMSHLGTKILYSIINKTDDLAMERCFTPWVDMEKELRARDLPLLSLESHRTLADFDVIGFSLQYEMTFTNILTMLDLGRVPLRNADRTLEHPLVIAGGPTATHPEAMAPFIDAFLIGDAEKRLPEILRQYTELKAAGTHTRTEILAELARGEGVYCPDLYATSIDPVSEFMVVDHATVEGVPDIVQRTIVPDISDYRFPDDSPVALAEAIFDRMSVEIARGCTEGCRFCQAGMIYRPVRERDPEQVVETVLSSLEKNGYDEAAITSLSTADYSCIAPLVKTLMERLRERKVSLGISSLRAYGLGEDTLDEIASVKATGLTFAPEAGTQRMRDVINKNVSEEDILTTCHRIFSRGWKKMKLYFILGLPTETDEDVLGIAEMGRLARNVGREYHRDVAVTVSVSSHVPKPHTPFQWAAMDSLDELGRKQRMLRDACRSAGVNFRRHDMRVSYLEGIITRGDRRTGDLIEAAWKKGARFDSWDDQLAWGAWMEALEEWETSTGMSREHILGTVPLDGKLPWDHIDVGLEEGFLELEYRKSLKSRLSPPCGKPFRANVHHTNVQEAEADERRLICYDCGIACDLSQMRSARIEYLDRLGAHEPVVTGDGPSRTQIATERHRAGLSPQTFEERPRYKYRVRYTKLGPVSLQGHLDMVREIPRLLIRAGFEPAYSRGFSPKPVQSFGPALGLGARALGEYVDVTIEGEAPAAGEVLVRLARVAPTGLEITGVRRLEDGDDSLARVIQRLEWAVVIPDDAGLDRATLEARLEEARAGGALPVTVERKKKKRTLDLWDSVESASIVPTDSLGLGDDVPEGRFALKFEQPSGDGASLKPHEIAAALFGLEFDTRDAVRLGCHAVTDAGEVVSPLAFAAPEPTALAEVPAL
jgi:radical SAM family uncharacterized protein/radical SAM-linked protein